MVHFTSIVSVMALMFHRVLAHTWIDCIDTDRKVVYEGNEDLIYGGTSAYGKCRGYMKNYVGRGDPDVNTKMTFKILMDDVPKGKPVCTPGPADYTGWRHRLSVKPGVKFYYSYMDNGHTSKDKAGRGTFYGVYWTGKPDTTLDKTTDLTDDKLIDGRLHDFDDGNCGQTYEDGAFFGTKLTGRAGNDFPCVGELMIPPGTKPGIYNLVWFWKFYNAKVNAAVKTTGGTYGGAAYSSCFQVEVLSDFAPESNLIPSHTTVPTIVPVPTTTAPVPVPTTTVPAPVPTTTALVPVPTTTVPAPVPTTTAPIPVPTTTAPVTVPTTLAPISYPSSTPTSPETKELCSSD